MRDTGTQFCAVTTKANTGACTCSLLEERKLLRRQDQSKPLSKLAKHAGQAGIGAWLTAVAQRG